MATRSRETKRTHQQRSGRMIVMSKMGKEGQEDVEEQELEVRTFEVEPAYVTVDVGCTKNLGDFESLRVSVRVSQPCYSEEIDGTFNELADRVTNMLYDEIDRQLKDEG